MSTGGPRCRMTARERTKLDKGVVHHLTERSRDAGLELAHAALLDGAALLQLRHGPAAAVVLKARGEGVRGL